MAVYKNEHILFLNWEMRQSIAYYVKITVFTSFA